MSSTPRRGYRHWAVRWALICLTKLPISFAPKFYRVDSFIPKYSLQPQLCPNNHAVITYFVVPSNQPRKASMKPIRGHESSKTLIFTPKKSTLVIFIHRYKTQTFHFIYHSKLKSLVINCILETLIHIT